MELGNNSKRNSIIYLNSKEGIDKIKQTNSGDTFYSCFAVSNGGTFLKNTNFQDDILAVPAQMVLHGRMKHKLPIHWERMNLRQFIHPKIP